MKSVGMENRTTSAQQQNERIRTKMFQYLCAGLSIGALSWFAICLSVGYFIPAIIPGAFILLTIINLVLCRSTGRTTLCMHFQVLISLLLPFLFQSTLGGLFSSGMVMFWSFVALAGALTFQRRASAMIWISFEVALILYWTFVDPVFGNSKGPNALVPIELQRRFLAFNIVAVTILIFSLAFYFVRIQGRMRKRLHEVRQEILEVNQALEDRNAEVAQGLRYARHLQSATLPDLTAQGDLFANSFIMDRSKDLVGGDIYWFGRCNERSFFVLLDCTGHGLSGAMLSMLCQGILNELVYKDQVSSASDLIRRTQLALDVRLNRGRSGTKDGAEMAVLCFDHGKHTVHFSGLGCSLLLEHAGEVVQLRGQRPLPCMIANWESLTDSRIPLFGGTRVFVYSDGVVDQFNGGDHAKFSTKRLVQEVATHSGTPLNHAGSSIAAALEKWTGDTDQLDDMLLIGFEMSAAWINADAKVHASSAA